MAIIVSLKDIVEALEIGTQTAENILDPATGEIILVTDDDELEIKEGIRLPNSYDINEWSLMEEFCYTIENVKQQEILLDSIRGKGAFQRFREALDRFVLKDEWSSFRQSALQKIAREWLEENKIAYKE